MPFADYEDFDDCVTQNSDKGNPEAYCAVIKDNVEGAELSESEATHLEDDPCEDGYTQVGTKQKDGRTVPNCVPDEDVPDAEGYENAALSQPRLLQTRSLDLEPIEREELGDNKVVYKSLKLLDSGVWTDQTSKTPTLYDDRTMDNVEPVYDSNQFDGPPVNVMHDLSPEGEPNEASISGHVEPDSIRASGGALFGDVVLDTSTAAGQFTDENLQSALESSGQVGFGGPSVELQPTEMAEDVDHPTAEEHVEKAELTGLGLVMQPASKSVDFAQETRTREVALSSKDAKAVYLKDNTMSAKTLTINDLRGDLEQYNIDTEDMTDEDILEFAKGLHGDLMEDLQEMDEAELMDDDEEEDDEDDSEMGDYGDHDDDEEEDKDMEHDSMEAMQEQLQNLATRLEDLEDAMSQALSADDVEQELSELKQELADAEAVEEVDKRLSAIEEQEKDRKTLADSGTGEDFDWSNADSGFATDTTGSYGG